MTGKIAWAGLNLVDVQAGDGIVISGATGAVGNVAGQLAKLLGLRSADFDSAFNYKAGPVRWMPSSACSEGETSTRW